MTVALLPLVVTSLDSGKVLIEGRARTESGEVSLKLEVKLIAKKKTSAPQKYHRMLWDVE